MRMKWIAALILLAAALALAAPSAWAADPAAVTLTLLSGNLGTASGDWQPAGSGKLKTAIKMTLLTPEGWTAGTLVSADMTNHAGTYAGTWLVEYSLPQNASGGVYLSAVNDECVVTITADASAADAVKTIGFTFSFKTDDPAATPEPATIDLINIPAYPATAVTVSPAFREVEQDARLVRLTATANGGTATPPAWGWIVRKGTQANSSDIAASDATMTFRDNVLSVDVKAAFTGTLLAVARVNTTYPAGAAIQSSPATITASSSSVGYEPSAAQQAEIAEFTNVAAADQSVLQSANTTNVMPAGVYTSVAPDNRVAGFVQVMQPVTAGKALTANMTNLPLLTLDTSGVLGGASLHAPTGDTDFRNSYKLYKVFDSANWIDLLAFAPDFFTYSPSTRMVYGRGVVVAVDGPAPLTAPSGFDIAHAGGGKYAVAYCNSYGTSQTRYMIFYDGTTDGTAVDPLLLVNPQAEGFEKLGSDCNAGVGMMGLAAALLALMGVARKR